MSKYAIIDIGTNSIKFLVAEKKSDGKWTIIMDESAIARLGEGLQATGRLTPSAMQRNVQAIRNMVEISQSEGVSEILAVGTMALRTAANANEFIAQVKGECGIDVEIISGEEEARLSCLAVKSNLTIPAGRLVVFDTGGGSTEFIFGQGETIEKRFSLNVGAVRYTEQIFKSNPVTEEEYKMGETAIEEAFSELKFDEKINALIGIGGTMSNLGAIKHQMAIYDPAVIHGSKLELSELAQLISLFKSKSIAERKKIIGLQPERADVILAGALIVRTIIKKASVNFVTISDRGLRHGLLVDRYSSEYRL